MANGNATVTLSLIDRVTPGLRRISQEVDRLNRLSQRGLGSATQRAAQGASSGGAGSSIGLGALKGLGGVANAATAAIKGLAVASATASTAVAGIAKMGMSIADTKTGTINRMSLAVGKANANKIYNESFSRASAIGASIADYNDITAGLLTRGGINSKEDAQRISDVMFAAGLASGASTAETNAATTQLLQALSSGVLQGDELKSIKENAPVLADVIAKGMGVSMGDLKEMGANGELTSDVVIEALKKGESSLGDVVDYAKNQEWTFDRLQTTVENMGTEYLQPLVTDFQSVATELGTFITSSGFKNSLQNGLQGSYEGLKQGFTSQFNMGAKLEEVSQTLNNFANNGFFEALGAIAGATYSGVIDLVYAISSLDFGNIGGAAADAISAIGDCFTAIMNSGLAQSVLDGLAVGLEVLATGLELLSSALTVVTGAVSNFLDSIMGKYIGAGNNDELYEGLGEEGYNRTSQYISDYNSTRGGSNTTQPATTQAIPTETVDTTALTMAQTVDQSSLSYVVDNASAINEAYASIATGVEPLQTALSGIKTTMDEIKASIEDCVDNAASWGEHFGANLADGLSAGLAEVTAIADQYVAQLARMKHSKPNDPALKGEELWGVHYAQNLSRGLDRGLSSLRSTMAGYVDTLSMKDSDGKITDASLSTLKSFNRNGYNKTINAPVTINMNNNFKGSQSDVQAIVRQIEQGLKQSIATAL